MNWQKQLQNSLTSQEQLAEMLKNPTLASLKPDQSLRQFPLKVPESYLRLIQKDNIHDPLLRQVLPTREEDKETEGYYQDPVGDLAAESSPGLLHKYNGRVLLVVTGACAIHCRYCFRRHFPYSESSISGNKLKTAIEIIQQDASIEEVILSGGDPLTLSDAKLHALVTQINSIEHVRRLRFHSRIPTVFPERILESNLEWLGEAGTSGVMVLHINHPREISDAAREAITKIRRKGVLLLNQAVLLKDVNDQAETQISLSHTLFENHILPYYLHMLDPVQGAAHFEVSDDRARQILQSMREKLPGYLVPKLVREKQGELSKSPL